jgi:hypothetical protein
MPDEQRAEQRRDVLAVGIGIGKDADLVIAQSGQITAARLGADCQADVVHFLRGQQFVLIELPGVQDLAAQRHDGLVFPVAGLLGRAAGRIAFDQEELERSGSVLVQSVSLPGSAGPLVIALAHHDARCLGALLGARMAYSAICSPASVCWLNQSEKCCP